MIVLYVQIFCWFFFFVEIQPYIFIITVFDLRDLLHWPWSIVPNILNQKLFLDCDRQSSGMKTVNITYLSIHFY